MGKNTNSFLANHMMVSLVSGMTSLRFSEGHYTSSLILGHLPEITQVATPSTSLGMTAALWRTSRMGTLVSHSHSAVEHATASYAHPTRETNLVLHRDANRDSGPAVQSDAQQTY